MHTRHAALGAADVQLAGGEVDIVPTQLHQLTRAQAVAVADQDGRCVPMAPAVLRLEAGADFLQRVNEPGAIEGYCRLRERGYFIQPKNALDLIEQLEALGSPIRAFVRARCEVGPGFEISHDDLFDRYKEWCQDENRRDAGSKNWFGRNLHSAIPGLRTIQRGEQKERFYVGVRCLYPRRDSDARPF
jgi:hypothetical protein